MNNEEIEKEYQDFLVKFSKTVKEIREDFDKMSDINKTRFEKNISKLLKVEFPKLLEFLRNN